MKKLIVTAALLGAGYYFFLRKDTDDTTATPAAAKLGLSDIFTQFDGQYIHDNHGYDLYVKDGKVTLIPAGSLPAGVSPTPVDLNVYDQFAATNPELINTLTSTSRIADQGIQVFSDLPQCGSLLS